MSAPYIRKAVEWLKARQGADGGWGEIVPVIGSIVATK